MAGLPQIPTNVPSPNQSPVVIGSVTIQQLLRRYNLSTLTSLKQPPNNYKGRVNQETNRDPAIDQKSFLDTPFLLGPVVTELQFSAVEYTEQRTGRKIRTQELHFACVLINLSQPKSIVKTEIDGRDGTVKEYIGLGDYTIDISGIIVADNGHYPMTEVAALQKVLNAPVPIPVVNKQLNNLGVYNIVVESYAFPQEPGGYSKQSYTINAISDYPIQIQIQ